MIYPAHKKGPCRVPGVHDPDSKRTFGIIFKPDVWQPDTVYYKYDEDNYNIVIPTVFTGFYYKVINPGKSTATEPTWTTTEGVQTTQDGTSLVWEAVNYNLLPPTESIASVTYTCTNDVTVSNLVTTASTAQFTIDVLPALAILEKNFEITCHAVKSNGDLFDTTLRFIVASR